MKTNYERNKFLFELCSCYLVVVLLFIGLKLTVSGSIESYDLVYIVVLAIAFAAIGMIFYKHLTEVYDNVEHASKIMHDVVLGKENIESERYEQGSIGLLYSNMYKMIGSLNESRKREYDEKVFLRDLIQDISHQLKTPLASLTVFVDLLLDDSVPDDESKKKMLEESKNQLSRMEWMVLSILKLARIEAGAIAFDMDMNNLNNILQEAASSVKYLTKERKQKVIIKCPKELRIKCDREWLCEAIINLLKNASDYSGKSKKIEINVEKTEVSVTVGIKDYGVGIDEKDITNIFKRFYRVNHEVNPNSVGIGLSLSKSIVEGMGGKITVRSEKGKYTDFKLTFISCY